MKEININIEGYNVNGICVGCLNYNRKMFYDDEVKECFKIIGNIDVPDGLTIQVCWECLAAVKAVIRFQTQILSAYDILISYSKEHTFLNSPKDFTQHATTNLHRSPVSFVDSTSKLDQDDDMKTEIEVEPKNEENMFLETEIKQEYYNEDTQFSDDFPSQEQSSDEDVQLSLIKEQKKKKIKKIKDKGKKSSQSRKLKNLPEHIVKLYTMTEDEMWAVRSGDVTSEEFNQLRHRCDSCVVAFNTDRLRQCHHNSKHSPEAGKPHQCDVCKAYFLTKDNLAVHRSLHLQAYKCRVCGACTTLKRRMLTHACTRAGSVATHPCNQCDQTFESKSKLSYHRSNACCQEKPQCDCCGKVFANKMTLRYHLKIGPQKNFKIKEKLHLPCKGCNKVFQSKKSYRAHVVIHSGLSYPCPICGKLFQWKRNLARHTRVHRERQAGALHRCTECDKTFSSRDCLANHMRLSKRHATEATYVHECNYCGKKFPTKWCMTDHIDWDHLKRVKYQCSVCFKAFKTAKIMVAHMNNIHEGKKREQDDGQEHLCDVCGKSYKTVKRLKAHVWAMHTTRERARSFKCALCPASFTWQTSIYKHMKTMHSKRTKPPPRVLPTPKKIEPYPQVEYFTHHTAVQPLHQNII